MVNVLTGCSIAGALRLNISATTILILVPQVISLLVRNLAPVSRNTGRLIRGRFPNQGLCVKVSDTLTINGRAILSTSLLLIPVALLVTMVLPKGRILPFNSLTAVPCVVTVVTTMFHNSVFQALINNVISVVLDLCVTS